MKIFFVIVLAIFFVIVALDFSDGQGSPAANSAAFLTLFKHKKKLREEAEKKRIETGTREPPKRRCFDGFFTRPC
jgi:hypothetical protein